MSGEGLKVEIDDKSAQEVLARTASRLASAPKAWKEVSLRLDQLIRGTFRTETDPWGVPWPIHSDVTLADRERREQYSLQMLIDSTDLFTSITPTSGIKSASVRVGEGLDYEEVHQFGNKHAQAWGRGDVEIPPRPYMPLSAPDEHDFPDAWTVEILKPISDDLAEAAR